MSRQGQMDLICLYFKSLAWMVGKGGGRKGRRSSLPCLAAVNVSTDNQVGP